VLLPTRDKLTDMRRRFALIAAIFPIAFSPVIGGQAAAPAPAASNRHVILISLDGFPAVALDNPRTPVPTLHRLVREGARAAAVIPVNPVVTWPNHTTYVTGVTPARHQVMFNGLLMRDVAGVPRIEPWRPKREMVKAPTVYDAAYAAGLTTAQVDWVAIHEPETITWAFAERPSANGVIEKEMVAAGRVTDDDIATFNKGTAAAWRDQVWTDAAVHILERHKPNLLLYHLLALDSTHHTYGPGTLASTTAMAFLDAQVARLLGALERSGLADKTTVVVLADHGFRTARRTLNLNVALRNAGLIRGDGAARQVEAWTMPWGGAAGIYLADPSRRATLVPTIEAAVTGLEGVDRVVSGAGLAALGLPDPAASDQAPDLVVAVRDGFDVGHADTGALVVDTDATHVGHHGALNTDPSMRALFLAWGHGIRPGVRLGDVRAIDVAPTVAEWLGVALPTADGTSLADALAGR
jgi:predicted AlkP superfamily pyrophosphatase or phosphodiesterase